MTRAAGPRSPRRRPDAQTANPRLRHCTLLAGADGEPITLVVGREYFTLTEDVGSRDVLLRLKSYLDGRHSIAEIARLVDLPERDVADVVSTFGEFGLLRDEEPLEVVPVEAFLSRLEDTVTMWGRQIGYHPLFGALAAGRARREVFVGLLLETYHYVSSAPKHVATAIAHCDRADWVRILAEYFDEESDHGELIIRALENVGVPREQTTTAHPIIGTISLINMLCEIGRSSTLGYLAATSLFEARREDFELARDEFHAIATGYGYPEEAVDPVIEHLAGDVLAGHTSLIREALADEEALPAATVHEVVNRLHDLKHSFDQYHDQILQYYSDISNYIPRLTVDYFSL